MTGTFPNNLEGSIRETSEETILKAVRAVASNAKNVDDFKDIASMLGIFKESDEG